jgi:nucleoside-diphosphate-sugar epimerase
MKNMVNMTKDSANTKLSMKKAVVLGATGGMGNALVERLLQEGIPTVAFARSADKLAALQERMMKLGYDGTQLEIVLGDAFRVEDVARAAVGADVIYQSVNVPYAEWKDKLIPQAQTVIDAARAVNARIAVIDNIYAYGRRQQDKVDEQHPKKPHTRKGNYRLAMEQLYLEAQKKGVQSAIFHLPDFYGPLAPNTLLYFTLAAIAAHKPSRYVGSQLIPREFIYMPDAAQAVVHAASFKEAYDQQWNIPGAGIITGAEIIRFANVAAGSTRKVGTVSKAMLRFVGLFQPQLRESVEMFYLNEEPLILSGQKYEQQFGKIPATPYQQAITDTILALRK